MAQRTDSGRYGVVGLTADWCSPADLDEARATELAAELNASGAGIYAFRWVGNTPVEAETWKPAGMLDVWLRHQFSYGDREWLGRVTEESGRVEWVRASDLRLDARHVAEG